MGILEWSIIDTPDSIPGTLREILNPRNQGAGITKIAVANDGTTFWAIVRRGDRNGISRGGAQVMLYRSLDGGLSWDDTPYQNLVRNQTNIPYGTFVWDIALATDDANIIAVVCANINVSPLVQEVWISFDNGINWDNTIWTLETDKTGIKLISTIDISRSFGDRKMLVGTRDGSGLATNNIQITNLSNYKKWSTQDLNGENPSINSVTGDILVAKFSPNFPEDKTIIIVYSNGELEPAHGGTWIATGIHDLATSSTKWQSFREHVEIRNSNNKPGDSPQINEIIRVNLELPSDFSGNDSNLRFFYVSTDAIDRVESVSPNRGVYRIENDIIHTLMDNTQTFGLVTSNKKTRRAASISYWGTCKSGKLLVGETLGLANKANVHVWFTDWPTMTPIPCWYLTKKPPSGAAGNISNTISDKDILGYGNAHIVWSPIYASTGVAYLATSSSSLGPWKIPEISDGGIVADISWPAGYVNVVPFDESAFSLTRNNGETWNQLSLINTLISKLTDVAISPDGTTLYVASTNANLGCQGFDSVWRNSANERIISPPLPPLPVGQVWERIRVSQTNEDPTMRCSKWALLRLSPDKLDGQVIFWAAGGTSGLAEIGGYPVGPNTKVVAWSSDYGDYWSDISPKIEVQDIAVESSTIIYILDIFGNVQKMPFTGVKWSNSLEIVPTYLCGGHTIEAQAADKVIVGNCTNSPLRFPVSISLDGGRSFIPYRKALNSQPKIGYHAIFDVDFFKNSTIYLCSDNDYDGLIYRQQAAGIAINWSEIMTGNQSHHSGYYGLVQTNHRNVTGQGTLYAAHCAPSKPKILYCGVERTLNPLAGSPIPGVFWDCLDASSFFQRQSKTVEFTLEPKSFKLFGCLSQDTNATLLAIDNDWYASNQNASTNHGGVVKVGESGMLWAYTDCVAKKGPLLTLPNATIIGVDEVTGRNQDIDFTWEQLCVSTHYQLQIAKDPTFSLLIADINDNMPSSITSPALIYMAAGRYTLPNTIPVPFLQEGHTYYWRCRVKQGITGQKIVSPWSDVRYFTISKTKKSSSKIIDQVSQAETTKINRKEARPGKKYHAFIAHASEDEKEVVNPLYVALREKGLKVWYDKFVLDIGDNIVHKVQQGLLESWYGIVVLSHHFFNKGFPRAELDALLNIEMEMSIDKSIILPIWHRIDKSEVDAKSVFLGGKWAYKTSEKSIEQIASGIYTKIIKDNFPIIE